MGSKETTQKKADQLGLNPGTAYNRLHKKMMFELLCECDRNKCYRCGDHIESADEMSLDHIVPWLDSEHPEEFFWREDNITFSHKSCNSAAARKGGHSEPVLELEYDGEEYFVRWVEDGHPWDVTLDAHDLIDAKIIARRVEDGVFNGCAGGVKFKLINGRKQNATYNG